MKRVLSVSLGSSQRDHEVELRLLGEPVTIARRGTDGDLERAEALIRTVDGEVDAIGLGGLDVYLVAGDVRYEIRDGVRLMRAAVRTPVVDGSGIKDTLERDAVFELRERGILKPGMKALMVSALDRFGMAEALQAIGCECVFGDLIFTAGIPYPIRTLEELAEMARRILPEMAKMPLSMLYPMGAAQERVQDDGRFRAHYEWADVVAGDWHLIHRYLPPRLDGKIILTNTTTADDVRLLTAAGAATLVTTTPVMEGRSFGTNVIEATIVALSGQRPEGLGRAGYEAWLRRLDFHPTVRTLTEGGM